MSTKHTPGPWKATKGGEIRAVQDSIEITIAVTFDLREDDRGTKKEANARLIAAAPELLEALRDLAGWAEMYRDSVAYESGRKHIYAARAAIAKAEGRT